MNTDYLDLEEKAVSFERDKISANTPDLEKYEPDHIPKGWGYEKWIINSFDHNYCGKLLYFEQGKMCSWHMHKNKDEAFFCAEGEILLLVGLDENIENAVEITLRPGNAYHVKRGQYHRMIGLGISNVLFEFSTLHKEDDSIRIEKGD
jgi:oxalate decarboxylase/phosphoglucose isomerase-like protein (cupin superfamily)